MPLTSMTAEEGCLTTNDVTSLRYHRVRVAQSRGVVVIVHGVGDHQGRYGALEAALHAAGFTIYGYDQRGHGRSSGERTDVRLFQNYIDDLDAVRDFVRAQEPEDRRLFVYGHSLGSVVALLHALYHPQHWQGVIASGCPLLPARAPGSWMQTLGHALAPLVPQLRLSLRIDVGDLTHDEQAAAAYLRDPLIAQSVTLRWGTEFLSATGELLREAVRLTMPVLLLHGEADPVAHVEGSRLLYERIGARDKRLCIYPGLLHELHNERPADGARVFADIIHWLGSHTAAVAMPA